MSAQDLEIGTLIGSRICHDLVSPIGAIGNGLELIGLTGKAEGPEMSLIEESLGNALARIKFFRLAFGRADEGQMVSGRETVEALEAMTQGKRCKVQAHLDGDVSRIDARIGCLAACCVESALAYGGEITIRKDSQGWNIIGSAGKLQVDARLWKLFEPNPKIEAIVPGEVHFLMLSKISLEAERSVRVEASETRISLRV